MFFGMVEIVSVAGDKSRLETFGRLILEYQAWLPEDLRVADLDDELPHLIERYGGEGMLLAYEGKRAIGCVVLSQRDARTAEIKRLFVVPGARGNGAGRALVEAAIGRAQSGGYRRIVLDTHRSRLEAAYGLYRALGFEECEAYDEASYTCPTFLALSLE